RAGPPAVRPANETPSTPRGHGVRCLACSRTRPRTGGGPLLRRPTDARTHDIAKAARGAAFRVLGTGAVPSHLTEKETDHPPGRPAGRPPPVRPAAPPHPRTRPRPRRGADRPGHALRPPRRPPRPGSGPRALPPDPRARLRRPRRRHAAAGP